MHASIEELLSLRDGEPDAERAAAHLAECAQCRAELEQLRHVRAALASLPLIEPARSAWTEVMQRATATAPAPRTRAWRFAALAGAAAATVIAAVVLFRAGGPDASQPATSVAAATPAPDAAAPAATVADPARDLDTDALVARSHRLEATLALMRFEPEVVNAGTAVTIATLEDHLAVVDYRLSLGVEDPLAPEQSRRLWQQRVDLMDSLVNVRYAQLQRVSY